MKRSLAHIRTAIVVMILSLPAVAQVTHDTLYVRKSQLLLFRDSLYVPVNDTLLSYPDSVRVSIQRNPYYKSDVFYDSLKAKAYRNRLTKELYKLLIRDRVRDVYESKEATKSESYFSSQSGLTIQRVLVKRVPVLEGNVRDTTVTEATSTIGKLTNTIHIPTHRSLIKRNILFDEGDTVNPYVLADSERLIRDLPYIEDARIYLLRDIEDSSKVTATIVIKDRFEWRLDGAFIDFTNYNARLTNTNAGGTGNRFSANYIYRQDRRHENGYEFRYASQSIGQSLVRVEALSAKNYRRDALQFRMYRSFVSPSIKYGGELVLGRSTDERSSRYDSVPSTYSTNFYHDLWAGHSFSVDPNDARKQLIVGGRFFTRQYSDRPLVTADSNEYFYNRNILLGTAFYQEINYFKARNVLAYGITEDIPVGIIASVLGGPETNEFERRWIIGSKFGLARYSKAWGYLGMVNQTETYFSKNLTKNFLMQTRLNYFSPVYSWKKTDIRNFFTIKHNYGRNMTPPRMVPIGQDLRGLAENQLRGNSTLSGRLETVFFLPTYLYGFRFAPLVYGDFAVVTRFGEDRQLAGTMGAGVRLRNESTVLQTLELSFFYIPDQIIESNSRIAVNISVSTPDIFQFLIPVKPNLLYEY